MEIKFRNNSIFLINHTILADGHFEQLNMVQIESNVSHKNVFINCRDGHEYRFWWDEKHNECIVHIQLVSSRKI